jgi:superfamily II RNA helicase
MPPATLLNALATYNLLPAIVFLPARRRCDAAASEAALMRREDQPERRERRREIVTAFAHENPEVRGHRHWHAIINGGVAAHHAGHIPAWKLLIERLMSAGLLDAIFATSTVAAGVDFPARTVVMSNTDARSSQGWRPISASQLQQMTGRAGRRGRDRVGFVVIAPAQHQDPERVAKLLTAPPDPLQSQFRATYTTLLNLLDAYGSFAQVRAIAEKSFAYRDTGHRIAHLEQQSADSERRVSERLAQTGLAIPFQAARGLERLSSALARIQERLPQSRAEMMFHWFDEVVVPGRVVTLGHSGRLAIVMRRNGGNFVGMREDGRGVNLPIERAGRVYSPVFPLTEKGIEAGFAKIHSKGRALALAEPRLQATRAAEDETLNLLHDTMERLLPAGLDDETRQKCLTALWEVRADVAASERASRSIESLRDEVWQPFERVARVLHHFGYLDFHAENVTARGQWLADLRLDHPLLVGEALRNELFDQADAPRAAALTAALIADPERDYGELALDDPAVTLLARFEDVAYEVATVEWRQGLEPAPEINFSAAAATARWAAGADWKTLVEETRAEEGDLVRMLSRTGEALLQIAGLRQTHPPAASIAAQAADAILREPVR